MAKTIKNIDFDDATKFLEFIRPSNDFWRKKGVGWIYRGQPSSQFELIPSAWRDQKINKLKPLIDKFKKEFDDHDNLNKWNLSLEYCAICAAEKFSIARFIKYSEDIGYNTGLSPRQHYRNISNIESIKPQDIGNPIIHDTAGALAQHHGIPTRLLDWTENPLVAAYFACNLNGINNQEAISVYALNSNFSKGSIIRIKNSELDPEGLFPSFIFQAPIRSTNDFMRIQRGLLTRLDNEESYFKKYNKFPSLEDYFSLYSQISNDNNDHLVKMNLDLRCVKELTNLLDMEGFNLLNLMPSLDNVGKYTLLRMAEL